MYGSSCLTTQCLTRASYPCFFFEAKKSNRKLRFKRKWKLENFLKFSKGYVGSYRDIVVSRNKNSLRIREGYAREDRKNTSAALASDCYLQYSPKNASKISYDFAKKKLNVKRKRGRPLKLCRSRTKESNGVTRTLVIVKGNQEIDSNYLKQHTDFKPILEALRQRIRTLKARKQKEAVTKMSPAKANADLVPALPHISSYSLSQDSSLANPERSLAVSKASPDTMIDKKEEVGNYGETQVTDLRTSSSKDKLQWGILGTIHTYEGPQRIYPKQHTNKSTSVDKTTSLSSLPLYDDRVLREATSGLRIFVNISSKDNKGQYHAPSKSANPTSSEDIKDTENNDLSSSISVDELFNDDDTKSSEKIDRLLSDDETTDALSKEIAKLLTDDPSSPLDSATSTDDIALVPDDSSTASSEPIAAPDDTVESSGKSSSPTVSSAMQNCLAKRGRDSTDCSVSAVCCSVCCPASKFK